MPRLQFLLFRPLTALLVVLAFGVPAFADKPKTREYPLTTPPLEIFDRLPTLKMGKVPSLSDDERTLLSKVWELRAKKPGSPVAADDALLLEAMLFASGVENVEARTKYREQFNGLMVKARETVNQTSGVKERGEQLMKFLHAGVMNKGYEAKQTSFTAIFDTGTFNCVSSTAIYYLAGTQRGLTLRPFSIPGSGYLPGHASLDMVDGDTRVQIEPTNPDGFDWQSKIKRPGVIILGYVPDRKDGHEIDALGIAAMIYSNRGVALSGEKPPRSLEAARCYLAALALDPADETASNNLQSIFVNWGPALTAEKKFEEAVRVLGFGLTIAPTSSSMQNNHGLAWAEYIEATLNSGNDKNALMLIERAAKAIPDDKDFQSASHWFIRHGQKLVKDKGFEAGLTIVDRDLSALPETEVKKLREWRSGVYRQWSQSLLEKSDADGSMKVLARAYALDPNDEEIIAGLVFHTQEALQKLEAKGMPAVVEHFTALCKQFPKVDKISEGGADHAARAIDKLADARKFQEAVEAVEKYGPLFTKPEQRKRAGSIAFDRWGRHLAEKKEWKAALEKYADGLKALPKQKLLMGNGIATVDEWAASAVKAKNWDEVIRIHRIGLEYFPGDDHLLRNLKYYERMKEKTN